MELVNKKKSAEENTSSNELESESVSDSQIVQNNSFSNLDLDLYNYWSKSTTRIRLSATWMLTPYETKLTL